MSAELDIDDVVGSFGTPLAKRELAQLRTDLADSTAQLELDNQKCLQLRLALALAQEAVEEAKPIVRHSANGENCWAEALTWWKKYGGTK